MDTQREEQIIQQLEEAGVIGNLVDLVASSVKTNYGTWEGRFVTVDQAFDEFTGNPIGTALMLMWGVTVLPDMDESLEGDAEDMRIIGSVVLTNLIEALVTKHNMDLAEAN